MMTVPPIGELLEKVDCRYTLAVEASKRACEIIEGKANDRQGGQGDNATPAQDLVYGGRPLYETKETNPLTIAIEEINRGLISYERAESEEF